MAIEVTLPPTSGFTAADLFGVIDYLTTDATVTGISTTQGTGIGTYDGETISYTILGTGFSLGQIGGETYINTGTLQKVVFTSATSGTVTFNNIDVDMAVFAPIIAADESGGAPLAIETFMLGKEWDVSLSNQDDIATKNTTVGDGALFNMIGNDTIRGMGGNDNLYSGDGNDKLFGNLGNDILAGGTGNDVVRGGVGKDRANGDAGNDRLFGDAGRDVLKGGAGRDVLDGGTGNDLLIGGKGADKFIFRDGYGNDRIKDFDATNNREDISLRAVTEITGMADLKANHMAQVGNDVVIDDGAGTVITLLGVDINDLGRGDFIF